MGKPHRNPEKTPLRMRRDEGQGRQKYRILERNGRFVPQVRKWWGWKGISDNVCRTKGTAEMEIDIYDHNLNNKRRIHYYAANPIKSE